MAGTLKTAATMLDLDTLRAETLIDNADPVRLAQSIEALDAWTSRRLMVVDDVLTNWVADCIARPNDSEGLANLESCIARALDSPATRAAGLRDAQPQAASDFVQRWRGFAEAVRSRHMKIDQRAPERIRTLKHVAEIESMLLDGTMEQSEIQLKVSLTPSRLSQVLSLMESNGLIERRSVGKKKLVSLPSRAPQATLPTQRDTPHMPRGASWLVPPKHAA